MATNRILYLTGPSASGLSSNFTNTISGWQITDMSIRGSADFDAGSLRWKPSDRLVVIVRNHGSAKDGLQGLSVKRTVPLANRIVDRLRATGNPTPSLIVMACCHMGNTRNWNPKDKALPAGVRILAPRSTFKDSIGKIWSPRKGKQGPQTTMGEILGTTGQLPSWPASLSAEHWTKAD